MKHLPFQSSYRPDFQVVEACSGVRYLIASFMVGSFSFLSAWPTR